MKWWQWVGVAAWCVFVALGVRKAFGHNPEAGLWQCVAGVLGMGFGISVAVLDLARRREQTLADQLEAERARRKAFRRAGWG